MAPRGRPSALASKLGIALAAATGLLPACGSTDRPPAPFGAQEIFPVRDPLLRLERFNADQTWVLYSRSRQAVSSWGCDLFDLYLLRLDSRRSQLLGESVCSYQDLWPDGSHARYLLVRQPSPGSSTAVLTAFDIESETGFDLDRVVPGSFELRPSDSGILLLREATSGARELWTGPLAAPVQLAADLDVRAWTWLDNNQIGVLGFAPLATAAAIYRVDLGSGIVNEEIPAHIDTAEWAGSGSPPALASDGILADAAKGGKANPLGRACWSGNCYLVYRRQMSDAGVRPFLYLINDKHEIALLDQAPDAISTPPADAPMWAWAADSWTPGAGRWLHLWHLDGRTIDACSIDPDPSISVFNWRGDGLTLAYSDGTSLLVTETSTTGCEIAGGATAEDVAFSPDNARLIWTEPDALWQADGHGKGSRLILAGPQLRVPLFLDTSRIIAERKSPDGHGLVWLDLDEPTPAEHAIVEQVFGQTWLLLGSRFVFVGNAYSSQDKTGTLSLVDLKQESVETMAETAADFLVAWPPLAGATSFAFIYLKAGRFPSDEDGFWLGAVPTERVQDN